MALGYDADIADNLKFTGQSSKVSKRPNERTNLKDKILTNFKVLGNFVSVHNKVFYEDQRHMPPPADYLNNLLNPNMNEVTAIDHANYDFTHDSDLILPRWSQEYPKFANNY